MDIERKENFEFQQAIKNIESHLPQGQKQLQERNGSMQSGGICKIYDEQFESCSLAQYNLGRKLFPTIKPADSAILLMNDKRNY